MTLATITIQQANTTDGSYDPRESRPKPVTLVATDPRVVYLGHPTNRGPDLGPFIGTVSAPGESDLEHMRGLPDNPEELVGRFLVMTDDSGFFADTRVIEAVVSTTEQE